jgi:hypothetical protein
VRLDLPSGRTVELKDKPNTADYVAILEAIERAQRGTSTLVAWAQVVGQTYLLTEDVLDGWDELDPDDTDAICGKAQELWREWQKQRRPKATKRKPSPDTSAETASS